MDRPRKKRGSSASKRADALCRKLKPHIVEMIEKNDPAAAVVTCPALQGIVAGNVYSDPLKDIWCRSPVLLDMRERSRSDTTA